MAGTAIAYKLNDVDLERLDRARAKRPYKTSRAMWSREAVLRELARQETLQEVEGNREEGRDKGPIGCRVRKQPESKEKRRCRIG